MVQINKTEVLSQQCSPLYFKIIIILFPIIESKTIKLTFVKIFRHSQKLSDVSNYIPIDVRSFKFENYENNYCEFNSFCASKINNCQFSFG